MLKKNREAMPRDADQTRKRILAAALVDFARKGLGVVPGSMRSRRAPRPTSA